MCEQSHGGSVRIYLRISYQRSFQILDKWLLLVKPNSKPASAKLLKNELPIDPYVG